MQVARLNWLQNFPVDRSREFPEDSLFAINSAANVTNAYVPILRTYEALVATGQLGLIRSQPIQMDLASLRKELEVYLDFRDQSTTLWLLSYKPMWDRYIGGEFGRGGGTVGPLPAPDVVEVMRAVLDKVFVVHGVRLTPEIEWWGDGDPPVIFRPRGGRPF